MTINELQNDFIKTVEGKNHHDPLFPNLAAKELNQPQFLECFFTEKSIHDMSLSNIFYSNSQRSNLFNHRFEKQNKACDEIAKVFSAAIWHDLTELCSRTIADGVQGDSNIQRLNEYVDQKLTLLHQERLINLTISEKTEALVLLCLLDALVADDRVVNTVVKVILNSVGGNPLGNGVNYKFIKFGHYPQSVADSITEESLDKLEPNEKGIYTLNNCEYIKCNNNIHSDIAKDQWMDIYFSDSNIVDKQKPYYYFKLEPLEWRVLEEDDEKMLLLCERIVDHELFNYQIAKHAFFFAGNYQANRWQGSNLFRSLNADMPGCFYYEAFNDEEQEQILEVEIQNTVRWKDNGHPGNTRQKVFSLSVDEAEKYISNFSDRENSMQIYKANNNATDLKCCLDSLGLLTDYAICRGVYPSDLTEYISYFDVYNIPMRAYNNLVSEDEVVAVLNAQGRIRVDEHLYSGTWWLRSPGNPDSKFDIDAEVDYTRKVCDVMADGHICTRGSNVDGGAYERWTRPEMCDGSRNGIRPAIYIKK